MKTIWINAGELSGDMQAAALLTALREREPELAAIGMGGPNLARAGQKNLFRVESLSVMGIMEVLTALPRALHMLSRIKKEMARLRPDAVVLVDAPEFNFRVAKIAHGLGIPVYYFIPPKIWAWRTGRVRFLQRYVKRLFCILPFEPAFYAHKGPYRADAGEPPQGSGSASAGVWESRPHLVATGPGRDLPLPARAEHARRKTPGALAVRRARRL